MVVVESPHGMQFRGIARSLWIGIAILMGGMLLWAWYEPPTDGFAAYARKMILTLILCFLCAPYVATGLASLAAWFVNADIDSPRNG